MRQLSRTFGKEVFATNHRRLHDDRFKSNIHGSLRVYRVCVDLDLGPILTKFVLHGADNLPKKLHENNLVVMK